MQQRKSVSSGTSHSGCAGNRTDHQLAQRIFRTQDEATVIFPSGDGSTLEGAPGDALLEDVFKRVKVPPNVLLMRPFVNVKFPPTEIFPPAPIDRPEVLLTSRLLKLFVPVKLPRAPPNIWAAEPVKETVAFTPEPLANAPESICMEPSINKWILLAVLSSVGPLIRRVLQMVRLEFGKVRV